jgi:hypothetical protein
MSAQRGSSLTTVLLGAVFGAVLSVPANPRFGLQIVDVRDLADLQTLGSRVVHAVA